MTLFAADINAGTQEQLATYRQQIDSLDQRIVELLEQRARAMCLKPTFVELNRQCRISLKQLSELGKMRTTWVRRWSSCLAKPSDISYLGQTH